MSLIQLIPFLNFQIQLFEEFIFGISTFKLMCLFQILTLNTVNIFELINVSILHTYNANKLDKL